MKKIAAGILLLLLLTMGCFALAEEAETEKTLFEQRCEQVDREFKKSKTVGAAFLVAMEGEIVFEHYYGVQQKTTDVPVSADSYFRCASVTKLITGIGLMRLMEQGILDPDEDISTYLGYTVYNPHVDMPITLRHLMSHTAGLNEGASYNRQSRTLSEMIDVEQLARSNFKDVEPGTEYEYSNFGAGVTGSIIECVTGQDVSSYMRETVFAPLGIDAAYTVAQLESPEDITASYKTDGSLNVSPSYMLREAADYVAQPDPDRHYRMTVGSLFIRPRDLMKLGIALAGDGTVDGVRVLSEESLALMRQPQSPETTGITEDTPYNFFTIRLDSLLEDRVVYGHQGTSEGIVCNLYYEPESEMVLVMMCNGCTAVRDHGVISLTRRLAALAQTWFLEPAQ